MESWSAVKRIAEVGCNMKKFDGNFYIVVQ
jgi:hypothetical protein